MAKKCFQILKETKPTIINQRSLYKSFAWKLESKILEILHNRNYDRYLFVLIQKKLRARDRSESAVEMQILERLSDSL